MGDIRVIVKRPNELYGHTVNISNDLKTFQGIVEGCELRSIPKGKDDEVHSDI